MKSVTLPQAYREIERLRQRVQEVELELEKERKVGKSAPRLIQPSSLPLPLTPDENASRDSGQSPHRQGLASRVLEGIHISTARSPHKTWYGPSSLFYFIGRINNFLTSALKQTPCPQKLLSNSAVNLLNEPPPRLEAEQDSRLFGTADDPVTVRENLTPTQEEYFLNLFWQSYYTLYPILDELEFKEHYQSLWTASDKERKPSALVDIVIALCMQYGLALVPGASHGINNYDAAVSGQFHYNRCQTLLSGEIENPTISTLQCHILCSVYLCCASFQNSADNSCALAVRTAYMLGLHLEPPQTIPLRERELRKRLWWAAYVLEGKMSIKLGRPFLVRDSSAACSLPADDREIAMLSSSSFAPLGKNVTWLTPTLHNIKLMLAVRAAYISIYSEAPDIPSACNPHPITNLLENWLKDVPEALKTRRQNNGIPFSTDQSPLEIEQFTPGWLQRQRLLLELTYHHLCTNLYRFSICFALAGGAPSQVADEASMKCAAHAMALTHMMHQVVLSTSIFAGWHEVFQWQWNAAMTLVGFVLAFPQDGSVWAARSAMNLSIVVFETFGNSFTVATSAGAVMSDLCDKVDLFMEHGGRPMKQEATPLNQPNKLPDEIPLVSTSPFSTYGLPVHEDSIAAQIMNGSLHFDDDATGVLAQSMDILAETYSDFDWSSLSH